MMLMTKEISKLAIKQYPLGSDMNQMIVGKFFDPTGSWTWYLMNQDPDDNDYLWGIVKGFEVEMGSFSLSELQSVKGAFGLGIERDKYFEPRKAEDVWKDLMDGKHV